ncbi:MAG: hypothetical protein ACK5L5_11320 [Bacteroidales bacterium]
MYILIECDENSKGSFPYIVIESPSYKLEYQMLFSHYNMSNVSELPSVTSAQLPDSVLCIWISSLWTDYK